MAAPSGRRGLPARRRDRPGPRPPSHARLGRGGLPQGPPRREARPRRGPGGLDRRLRRARAPGPLGSDGLASAGPADVQVDPGRYRGRTGQFPAGRRPLPGTCPPRGEARRRGGTPASASHAMTRSLEDPTFAGRVESVAADLSYRVEFAGREQPDVPRPRVREPRADPDRREARLPGLHLPRAQDRRGYPPRHGRRGDRGHVALPPQQGGRLGEAGRREGREIALSPPTGDSPLYSTKLTLADPHRYKVQLVDREGRRNKLAAELGVNVDQEPAADHRHDPARRMTSGCRRWRSSA